MTNDAFDDLLRQQRDHAINAAREIAQRADGRALTPWEVSELDGHLADADRALRQLQLSATTTGDTHA